MLPQEWSALRPALDGELVLDMSLSPYALQETFGKWKTVFELNNFDLNGKSICLRPPGLWTCISDSESFPEVPGGADLLLSDDDSREVTFSDGFSFPFFGSVYSSVHISSNGCLTFGAADNLTLVSGDSFYNMNKLLSVHNSLPRVSAAFMDLNPELGGSVTFRQLNDRFVVTFRDVLTDHQRAAGGQSFQIVLHSDGEITMTFLRVSMDFISAANDETTLVTGVSSGNSGDAVSIDLSASVLCSALAGEPYDGDCSDCSSSSSV